MTYPPLPDSPNEAGGIARQGRGGPDVFRVLYVCTGNICRSAFAEILTRHLLINRLGGSQAAAVEIASAGTRAVAGAPIHPATRDELQPWGLDRTASGRFAARLLHPASIERADLVLGATVQHRSAAVALAPAALTTAFSLREFARLAASVDHALLPADPATRAHLAVRQALALRGVLPPRDPGEDHVPDPVGCPPSAHHTAARLIRDAVHTIVEIIAPRVRYPL